MLDYALNHYDKLGSAFFEHVCIVVAVIVLSLVMAGLLTLAAMYSKILAAFLVHFFSVVYSIPSLALFAVLIPVTGLGKTTAFIVLVLYNQYILLRNFIAGLNSVEPAIVEAAQGMGMTISQILFRIRLPLSLGPLFAGIRLATVSTIGIATIAASINAGGLGVLLFDGLRSMNVHKIVWGAILSACLAIGSNAALALLESKMTRIIS